MKKIWILFALIVAIILFCLGATKHESQRDGILVTMEPNVSVSITYKQSKFEEWFHKVTADIIVEGDGINYTYLTSNPPFEMEGYYALAVRRMYKEDGGLATVGYLYYDEEMKNLVVVTDEEKIYSATDEFIQMVVIP